MSSTELFDWHETVSDKELVACEPMLWDEIVSDQELMQVLQEYESMDCNGAVLDLINGFVDCESLDWNDIVLDEIDELLLLQYCDNVLATNHPPSN